MPLPVIGTTLVLVFGVVVVTLGCAQRTRVVTVPPPAPCPSVVRPCRAEAPRPRACAPAPLVGRVLWEDPDVTVRVYEKCTWGSAAAGPAVDDHTVVIEHPGRASLSMDALKALFRPTIVRRMDSVPGAVRSSVRVCRPEVAGAPGVPCLSLSIVTPRVEVGELASYAKRLLAGVGSDDGCFLVEVEVGAAEPILLQQRQ